MNANKLAALIRTLSKIAGAALDAAEDSATCDDALAALEVIEARCRVAVLEHYGTAWPADAPEGDPVACTEAPPF